MDRLLVVCLGGALGSAARYLLGGFVQRYAATMFPAGTVVVNVLGSFLMGLVMQLGADTRTISPLLRLALTTGFLGGFTTMSAFAFETMSLLEGNASRLAFANIAATVVACLAACWLGLATARSLAAS